MNKPTLSPNFTIEDIRLLRNYNSARHIKMDFEEMRNEGRKSMENLLKSIGKESLIATL